MMVNDTTGMSGQGYEYGYNAASITALIDQIKLDALTNAAAYATGDGLTTINGVVDSYIDGEATQRLKNLFAYDANLFKQNVEALVGAVEIELTNAGVNYQNFDKNLLEGVTGSDYSAPAE